MIFKYVTEKLTQTRFVNPDASLKEKSSGVINLKDEPEFADAVDCMMEYFYRAGYDTAKYDMSSPLLHAQVAVVADKYECTSLYDLAKKSLAGCIGTAGVEDWVEIADLIYRYTTTEMEAHAGLRKLIVVSVPGHPNVLESFFQHSNVEELLRSYADLGADLLLSRIQKDRPRTTRLQIFTCDHCYYAHAGSADCPDVNLSYPDVSMFSGSVNRICPQCRKKDKVMTKKFFKSVKSQRAQPCPSCEGICTQASQDIKLEPADIVEF